MASENVYDILINEKLIFTLSSKHSIKPTNIPSCAVVIHLHYEDRVIHYIEYINHIPEEIDIIITYSNDGIIEKLTELLHRRDIIYIKKQNRGRDISALLVAAREHLKNYEFFAFIHDKKEKYDDIYNLIKSWNKNLWENILASPHYIYNVLSLMEDEELGLMVPPTLLHPQTSMAFNSLWEGDFSITMNLMEKLNIDPVMDENIPVITIGTAFWARTAALEKLLDYNWKYDDFPEEPLADDGTINHAIERSFAFIAQERGYKTAWIMSEEYSKERFIMQQNISRNVFKILKIINIEKPEMVSEFLKFRELGQKLKNQKLYICGTGQYPKTVLSWTILTDNISVNAFILVPEGGPTVEEIKGIPVINIDKADPNGLFIAYFRGKTLIKHTAKYLISKGISEENIIIFRR